MSDAPLTKEQIEKIRVEASAPDVQEGLVSMIPNEVRALCTLALRGLEAERVREETLEEVAKTLESAANSYAARAQELFAEGRSTLAMDADNSERALCKAATHIRALKKGTSDANL